MYLRQRAQAILEYSILIAIIIAALVVMQSMMKRGYQGRIKDSSDRMAGGDSFSLSDSTILEDRQMTGNRNIHDETSTHTVTNTTVVSNFGTPVPIGGTTAEGYTVSVSTGGATTSRTMSKMSGAADEGYRLGEYTPNTYSSLDPLGNDVNAVFQ